MLGVLEAEQREPRRSMFRNDRLIAASVASKRHGGLLQLRDLDRRAAGPVEAYLVTYASSRDKTVRFIARRDPRSRIVFFGARSATADRPTAR